MLVPGSDIIHYFQNAATLSRSNTSIAKMHSKIMVGVHDSHELQLLRYRKLYVHHSPPR